MNIKALYYDYKNIGKNIKSSKRRYLWKLCVNGADYKIELFVSYLTGKRRILRNDTVIFEVQKPLSSFYQEFSIAGARITIKEIGDSYYLFVNNRRFEDIWRYQKIDPIVQLEAPKKDVNRPYPAERQSAPKLQMYSISNPVQGAGVYKRVSFAEGQAANQKTTGNLADTNKSEQQKSISQSNLSRTELWEKQALSDMNGWGVTDSTPRQSNSSKQSEKQQKASQKIVTDLLDFEETSEPKTASPEKLAANNVASTSKHSEFIRGSHPESVEKKAKLETHDDFFSPMKVPSKFSNNNDSDEEENAANKEENKNSAEPTRQFNTFEDLFPGAPTKKSQDKIVPSPNEVVASSKQGMSASQNDLDLISFDTLEQSNLGRSNNTNTSVFEDKNRVPLNMNWQSASYPINQTHSMYSNHQYSISGQERGAWTQMLVQP